MNVVMAGSRSASAFDVERVCHDYNNGRWGTEFSKELNGGFRMELTDPSWAFQYN